MSMESQQQVQEESFIERVFRLRETHAWELFKNARYVYRVDTVDMLGVMTKKGIIAQYEIEEGRKGFFFFVGGKKWASTVAMSFLPPTEPYVLHRFRKSALDLNAVRWDNVAENAAAVSFYCLQEKVEHKYVECMGVYEFKTILTNVIR